MQDILKELLLKYYKRVKQTTDSNIVSVSIGERKFDAHFELEDYVNKLECLQEMGFVNIKRKSNERKLSVKKVCLNLDKISEAESYLQSVDKNFVPLNNAVDKVDAFIKKYGQSANAAALYLKEVRSNKFAHLETLDKDEIVLKCIIGLEENTENIYLREFSQNIYGDSHLLDDGKVLNVALKHIRAYYVNNNSDNKRNEYGYCYKEKWVGDLSDKELLQVFHVYKTDDLIRLKGNIEIETERFYLNLADLEQGIALPQSSLKDIRSVKVLGNKEFLTVENLTSYERISDNAVFYLGGFASKDQMRFIRDVGKNNKDVLYFHFGDLDVGGLRIFKNLRDETGIDFQLKYMDEKYLQTDYAKLISKKEKLNLEKLMQYPETMDLAKKILEAGKKVEQEIISLDLSK